MISRIFLLYILVIWVFGLSAQVFPLNKKEVANPVRSWELQQPWEEFNDLDGRFKVSIPAAWDHRIDTIATVVGQQAYHTFFLQSPSDTADNVMYMLSYVDYPVNSLHHDSAALVKELLDVTIEEAKENVRGEVLFDTERERNGYPGRYWRIDYLNGRASIRTQAFVAGNRYYALQTVSKNALGVNSSTDRFFDSLVLF